MAFQPATFVTLLSPSVYRGERQGFFFKCYSCDKGLEGLGVGGSRLLRSISSWRSPEGYLYSENCQGLL